MKNYIDLNLGDKEKYLHEICHLGPSDRDGLKWNLGFEHLN